MLRNKSVRKPPPSFLVNDNDQDIESELKLQQQEPASVEVSHESDDVEAMLLELRDFL